MEKNKEYKFGIKKIEKYNGDNKLINNYLKTIKKISKKNNFYPGSPLIISNISNNSDKLYFCELHTNEFNNIKKNLNHFTNIKNINSDGFNFVEKKIWLNTVKKINIKIPTCLKNLYNFPSPKKKI